MRRILLFIALTATILAGCSSIEEGKVVDKNYYAAYNSTYWTSQCMAYDSKGMCTFNMPVQQTQHHSERWELTLKVMSGEDAGDTGTVDVGQGLYEKCQIGNLYSHGECLEQ